MHTCQRCGKEFKPTSTAQLYKKITITTNRDYPVVEKIGYIGELCPICYRNLRKWLKYRAKTDRNCKDYVDPILTGMASFAGVLFGNSEDQLYPVTHGPHDCGCSEEVLKK